MTADERFALASSPAAAPIVTAHSTMCSGDAAVERFRMITCLSGLRLESHGIRVNARISMLKVARRDYGVTAKNAAVAHERLRAKMLDLGIIAAKS